MLPVVLPATAPVAGAPPIAVVPVAGVPVVVLPGVVGPARALLVPAVVLLDEPTVGEVVELPTVELPVVVPLLAVVPRLLLAVVPGGHGTPFAVVPEVCASAAPVDAAIPNAASAVAKRLMRNFICGLLCDETHRAAIHMPVLG